MLRTETQEPQKLSCNHCSLADNSLELPLLSGTLWNSHCSPELSGTPTALQNSPELPLLSGTLWNSHCSPELSGTPTALRNSVFLLI
ncbi:hypothetical protein ANANG_G00268740 [Anguilla anguilla]|uniref:Uncharacterized protein n=1 Tax=Anguilla anguilla TaxID=7936 RepID=A0A9D3LRP8_ANGAN|nr:hypothetical protein ANANG_G00268740 [Anguilla anguilla]